MAWGKSSAAGGGSFVDDWIKKLENNESTLNALYIMSFRKVSSSDFQRLCKAIRHNTSLKELHSGHALTKEDIRALADALSENQGLQSLSIGDKSFGNEGVSLLSAGLARNRTLKKLDLENKGISLEGCVSLSQVLSNSECGIEQLILSRNSLTDDSIKALLDQGAPSLRSFDLSQNNLSLNAADALSTWLSSPTCTIQELTLANNESFDGNCMVAMAEGLVRNSSLTAISLRECPIGSSGIDAFCSALMERKCDAEQTLNFAGCRIEKDSGAAFGRLLAAQSCHVEQLILAGNSLSSEGFVQLVSSLSCNSSLHVLDVASNGIGADAIPYLSGAKHLQTLRLFDNPINDEGAKALCEVQGLDALEELDLSGIGITDHGIELICTALKSNPQLMPLLTSQEVGGNKVSDKARWDELTKDVRPNLKIVWGEGKHKH